MDVYRTFWTSGTLAAYAAAMAVAGVLPLLHILLFSMAALLTWFCFLVSIVPMVEWSRERISPRTARYGYRSVSDGRHGQERPDFATDARPKPISLHHAATLPAREVVSGKPQMDRETNADDTLAEARLAEH